MLPVMKNMQDDNSHPSHIQNLQRKKKTKTELEGNVLGKHLLKFNTVLDLD